GRERLTKFEDEDHAATKAHEISQGAQGPHSRSGQRRHDAEFRLFWPEGARAGAGDGTPDRGRTPGDHSSYEACRPRLDSYFPGPSGDEEASRGPHGVR